MQAQLMMAGVVLLLATTIAAAGSDVAARLGTNRPSDALDTEYLNTLAKDTWHCVAGMAHPGTGIPFDSNEHNPNTSVSNIGIYLTCIVVARDMGIITPVEAERRIEQTLNSVEQLRTWHGFQQCWNDAATLEPASNDHTISVLDTGNFVGGLLTAAQACPKFSDRVHRITDAMRWQDFYDKQTGLVIGGFKTDSLEFVKTWQLNSLGYDSQLAQFLAIASGAAPPTMWDKLDRSTDKRCGAVFMKPAWQGGGLFLQYIGGLWLDNRGTFLARSAKNYAYSQIMYARQIGSPAWGWSSCANPNNHGYMGSGDLKDEVVTPHAVALAIEDFPQEAIKCLRAIETTGIRTPDQGFYDSVNLKTGEKSDTFLILDQGMLLISLGNYLRDDCVRGYFQADPLVKRGRKLIREFSDQAYASSLMSALPDANASPSDTLPPSN
ncbi:MAG: glucoamylase family protein [Tepidisphaeraceae bacterium]|jgi:hypothetical protein